MKFDFYIFGTPAKFELYPNKKGKVQYFKRFNDSNAENVKLVICVDVEIITYSYLRYNLITSNNKPAFFGMSLEFTNEYCTDVKSLYAGLDMIYNEVVLKSSMFLKKANGQTQFVITSFQDVQIQKLIDDNIKYSVGRFIENELGNTFKEIDKSFKFQQAEKPQKLNINTDNDSILRAVKKYTEISISPEYKEKPVVTKKVEVKEKEKGTDEPPETEANDNNSEVTTEETSNIKSLWKSKWVKFLIICNIIAFIVMLTILFKR